MIELRATRRAGSGAPRAACAPIFSTKRSGGQVAATLRNPRLIMEAALRYRESHAGQRDELLMRLEASRDGLARIPEERERVQTLYREGFASFEETKTHLARIERKRAALLEEREMLEARLAMQTADEAKADQLDRLVREVADRLQQLPPEKRAEVVRAFVRRVVVKPGPEIEVHAFVPLPESGKHSQYVGALWGPAASVPRSIASSREYGG